MPVTVETTSFAYPWQAAIHTMASTARFQSISNTVGDLAAAKEKFKLFWHDGPLTEGEIIRVAVRGMDEDVSTFFALGEFDWSGPIVMFAEYVTPQAYRSDHEEAGKNFLNHLGKIRYEMQALVNTDPSQYLNGTLALSKHGEGDPKQNNGIPFWGAELIYSWSGQ